MRVAVFNQQNRSRAPPSDFYAKLFIFYSPIIYVFLTNIVPSQVVGAYPSHN